MDIRIFAQLMANNCTPQFANLVLQVPIRHSDDKVQRRLISSITHGNQMARICQGGESLDMIYATTEHIFNEATPQGIATQEDGHRVIVSMVSHATGMARIATAGADEIYAAVRPMAHERLPQNAVESRRLHGRLEDARRKVSDICHRVSMERLLHSIGQR
jgi:hypothetical protein